ncbi:MAG TPA: RluA family pseudouridine synthase [Euzebyales bacterium]|nr:RluA family pseudouridine synthase [Euzebyales bacterium]
MGPARLVVPAEARGDRIDRVVAALLDEPRAQAQARVGRGEVTVDGAVVRKSYRVRGGEHVEVADAPAGAVAAPPPVPVRYADEHVVVVAKPAGMVVHPGAGVGDGTLVDALRAMGVTLAPGDDPARPGIVHRLDRGTSGLLVVARTGEALRGLREQFDVHSITRHYWALVEGSPAHARATVDAPIARHPGDRTRFRTAADGRPAVSHYEVKRSWGRATSLHVTLETGRTHQVRVHMAALGHPVVGDRAYGASAELASDLELDRPALHAAHLGFAHPVTGAHVALDEPCPDDLRRAVRRLDAVGGGPATDPAGGVGSGGDGPGVC